MKNNSRSIAVLFLLVGLTIALVACNPEAEQGLSELGDIRLPTDTPTVTPTPSNTPLPPPPNTPIPAPTDTAVPPPTDTAVPPPTDTAVPPPTEAPSAEATESSGSSEAGPTESTESSESPEAKPTEPTETSEPSDGDVADPIFDRDTFAGVGDLDFFSNRTDVFWNGLDSNGGEVLGSMFYEVDLIRGPQVQRIEVGGEHPFLQNFASLGDQSLEMFVREDLMYFDFEGQEYTIPVQETGFDAESMAFFVSDGLLAELAGPTYERQRVLDGLNLDFWTFDETQLIPADGGESKIEKATGLMAILEEAGWIVEASLEITGTEISLPNGKVLESGTLSSTSLFSDINRPFLIDIPPAIQEEDQTPEELPVPPGAQRLEQTPYGKLFWTTDLPPQVADFYLTSMLENGWTLTSETVGNPHTLEFEKEGTEVEVTAKDSVRTGETFVHVFIVSSP